MDREQIVKGLDALSKAMHENQCYACSHEFIEVVHEFGTNIIDDAISLLKAQKIEEPHPWEHIWDAPDYTFEGRCRNCGFIHYFIQGHDAQYRFCPQCGEQKVI